MTLHTIRRKRKGNILVLTACMMVVMVGMLACAIDLGYLYVAREEMQRSADSTALAGAWELIDESTLTGSGDVYIVETNARAFAAQYAGLNKVLNAAPALAQDDVIIGFMDDPTDASSSISQTTGNASNAVWVRVRRTASQNGEVPFFLAKILGIDRAATEVDAIAAVRSNFQGFQTPSAGSLDILPFALDENTWNDLLIGNATDNWTWDSVDQEVESGSDGILEVNLYPQSTGSPGNRGTVDIGSSNNSTADIARQIVDGVSVNDLSYHGGKLEFDEWGELGLNGDTGISAGVKDELESIKGLPRIIPIFRDVTGLGNNAMYTIVRFAGVRIMEVKLTGNPSSKRVIVQPASVVARGGIPTTASSTTDFVYSPAWLVR
ncbi:MAG: hypothetical protein CMJ64_27985 [Planctomycetaceae bacterium]|nr:hypothetical protein [Planctomycetaceae bacterium]